MNKKMLKNYTPLINIIVLLVLLNVISCKNATEPPDPPKPPPVDNRKLTLTVVSAGFTEIDLMLQSDSIDFIYPYDGLLKYDNTVKRISIGAKKTNLHIDKLQAQKEYTFQFSIDNDSLKSNILPVKTKDTTSSNFTWQTFLFGEHSHSTIRDVAIINENNIWAVGDIYLNDSIGQPDPLCYNVVHWDGVKWKPLRVTVLFRGNMTTAPIQGIYANSESDIWLTTSLPIHGDGVNWQLFDVRTTVDPYLICNKIWRVSSQNIYSIGRNGSIAHFDGQTWRRIESGTDVDLNDIWGSPDGTVWACGYKSDYSKTVLLKIKGTTVTKLYEGSPNDFNNNEYVNLLTGGWTNSNEYTYVLNNQYIFKQDNKSNLDIKRISENYSVFGHTLSALNTDDIIIAGEQGLAGHFNGYMLNIFRNLTNNTDIYLGSKFKGHTAILVGYRYNGFISSQAILTIGKR